MSGQRRRYFMTHTYCRVPDGKDNEIILIYVGVENVDVFVGFVLVFLYPHRRSGGWRFCRRVDGN